MDVNVKHDRRETRMLGGIPVAIVTSMVSVNSEQMVQFNGVHSKHQVIEKKMLYQQRYFNGK